MKTEREKMISEELYDISDPELVELRDIARDMAKKYNQTAEHEKEERRELLTGFLGSFGEHSEIFPDVNFDYGCNIYIGERCYINFNTVFLDCASIHIGNDIFIGPNVSFLTPIHPLIAEERKVHFTAKGNPYNYIIAKPITVEDNVWIGGDVSILPGVTIGRDSVIGAGSVVTKDIPSGVIAVGNPCRVIRKITEADSVE